MLLKKSRCFLILAALSVFLACKGESEAKQTVNTHTDENTDTDLNSNIREYKLEKIADLSDFYGSRICDMQVDPDHKESTLLWVKTKNAKDDELVDRLALWNGESQLSLKKFDQSLNPIVALSPFRNGILHKTTLEPVNISAEEETYYFKGRYIFNILSFGSLDESHSSIQFTNEDLGTDEHVYSHRNGCGNYPVILKNLSESNLVTLVKTEDKLKLLNYDVSGRLKWSKILQTKPNTKNAPWRIDSEISVNKNDDIAILFNLPSDEIFELEKIYQVSLNRQNSGFIKMIIIFDKNGQLLKIQDLADLGSVKLTWVDQDRIALISSNRANGQDKIRMFLISKNPKEKEIEIPIDFESNLVFVKEIRAVNENQILISGDVDYLQAGTGSVMIRGKVFVGIYDLEDRKFVYTQRLASDRDNRVTAVSEESPGVFLIATNEGSLTHNEDSHSQSFIYRLSPSNHL